MDRLETPELDALLDEAGEALDDGRAEDGLRLAHRALEMDAGSATALSLEAEALALLDRADEAEERLEEAVRRRAGDPEVLLAAASFAVDWLDDDHDAVRQALDRIGDAIKVAKRRDDSSLMGDLHLAESRALCVLGDLQGSAAACERARDVLGDEPEVLLELAMAWFEILRLDDADDALRRVLADIPDEARAHHYRGLVAERRGDRKEAAAHFAQARRLDPESYPKGVELSNEAFEKAVEVALEKVPERVREKMKDVPVMVEDLPRDEDLTGDPPLSPLSLGMFRGHSIRERSLMDPWTELPGSIILYKRNLERDAATRADLVEQIEQTVVHEVGHFVGWDEEDLHERGLD